MDKLIVYIFAVIGLIALFCAIFLDAPHLYFVFGSCALIFLVCWKDIKKDIKPKSKYTYENKKRTT